MTLRHAVKANASENALTRLSTDEMLSQMRTVMFAGHETTANTLCWTLLELARHPEVQSRLRTEIRAAEREARSRGVSELSTTELDNMPLTLAVIKVCIIAPRIAFL
jgi:cytochrome P450